MFSAFLLAIGMLCIYGKINNSAYICWGASFNHWDASFNHWDTSFNCQDAKCCVFMVKSITLPISVGAQVLTIRMQVLTVGMQNAPAYILRTLCELSSFPRVCLRTNVDQT